MPVPGHPGSLAYASPSFWIIVDPKYQQALFLFVSFLIFKCVCYFSIRSVSWLESDDFPVALEISLGVGPFG